MTKSDKIEK